MEITSLLKSSKKCKTVIINAKDIIPNPLQPRRVFDKDELIALSASIKNCGLIQPIAVKRIENSKSKYEIIAGERRWRACMLAGINELPCVVFETSKTGSALMALIENLQRSDLSFFEEAIAMQTLLKVTDMPQSELAHALSISQCTLSNKLRLLRLSERERLIVLENNLSERHCRALIRIESEQERLNILQTIINKNLTSAETEKLIDNYFSNAEVIPIKEIKKVPTVKGKLKDIKLLYNTIDKAIGLLKTSGYNASWNKQEDGNDLIVTINIKR